MFTELDQARAFALTVASKLKNDGYVESNKDVYEIQDLILIHLLAGIKQDDCLIPDGGEAYEVTDFCDEYGVAFISSGGIPLGIFVIYLDSFEEDDIDVERLYVSINHTVVYLDGHNSDEEE